MKNLNGFPVIEPQDHPEVVDRALRDSLGYWRAHMDEDRAHRWMHTAMNSWETLHDDHGLGIDDLDLRKEISRHRDSPLYMQPDELELALVVYGCDILDKKIDEPRRAKSTGLMPYCGQSIKSSANYSSKTETMG